MWLCVGEARRTTSIRAFVAYSEARFIKHYEELTYRYYVTSALKALGDGMTMERTFYDIMNEKEQLSPEEVIAQLREKGLTVE